MRLARGCQPASARVPGISGIEFVLTGPTVSALPRVWHAQCASTHASAFASKERESSLFLDANEGATPSPASKLAHGGSHRRRSNVPLLAPVPEFPFFGGPGAAPGHSGSPSRQATRLRLQVAVDDLSSVRALDACGGLSDVAGMSPPEEHVALLHRHQALAGLAAVAPAHPRPEVHMPDDYFSRLSSRLRTDAARDIVKVTEIAQLDVGKRRQVVVQLSESSLNGPAARVVLREPPPADPAAWRRETFVFLRAPELDAFIEALQAARAKLPTEGA